MAMTSQSAGADGHHEILLVRHGRSSLEVPSHRITLAEFREWIDEYNRAGIAESSLPPPALAAFARETPRLVCSDLQRAVASAARLAPDRPVLASPLYREVGRPMPGSFRIRLSCRSGTASLSSSGG